jgi:hypothetical protein
LLPARQPAVGQYHALLKAASTAEVPKNLLIDGKAAEQPSFFHHDETSLIVHRKNF